jgi:hypothetical protein
MSRRDHAPRRFHAVYAEFEAEIDVRTLEGIRGSLPRRVPGMKHGKGELKARPFYPSTAGFAQPAGYDGAKRRGDLPARRRCGSRRIDRP